MSDSCNWNNKRHNKDILCMYYVIQYYYSLLLIFINNIIGNSLSLYLI